MLALGIIINIRDSSNIRDFILDLEIREGFPRSTNEVTPGKAN